MRFVFPYMLTALSVLPVLALVWLWMLRRSEKRAAGFSASSGNAAGGKVLQLALLIAGLAFLTVAASRPQWGRGEEKVLAKGRNLVVALDVSRSMLALDVHPNRLERAKTDILDLVEELDGDRAALLAFRGKGELICPLTSDYAFFRQALDGVSPESAPRGETDIADALNKSLAALDPAQDEYSAILLISDGGDLKGRAAEGARKAHERGIPVFTVGIGSETGAAVPGADGKGDQLYQGKKVTTKLESSVLGEIAKISGGRYIALGTAGTADTTLGAIYRRHLRNIAAKEQREAQELRYRERFQWFLVPSVLLFFAAAALSRGRLCGASRRKAVLLLALFAVPVFADTNDLASISNANAAVASGLREIAPGRAGAREAQRLFADGKWELAAQAYEIAARGAETDESEVFMFNAAIAKMRAGKDGEAIEILRRLLGSRRLSARAGALAGKLLVAKSSAADEGEKLDALTKAAEAFQTALRQNPSDEAGVRNLSRALDALPQARDNAHIAKVLAANQNAQMPDVLGKMLAEQRSLRKDAEKVFAATNAAEMIRESEALAKRQSENTDLWIVLKAGLLQSLTNENMKAEISRDIELCRKAMRDCSAMFEDVNPAAVQGAELPEPRIYDYWKAAAMPPELIDEDMHCQTNAIVPGGEAYFSVRDAQKEALSLTTAFRERFPRWAEQYVAQAAQNTNMPPFTAENRATIERLAKEVEELQTPVAGNTLSEDAKKLAYSKLEEIRKLLPRQNNSQQGNPPPQQNDDRQDQQQNQPKDQNQQNDDKQDRQQDRQEEQEKKESQPQSRQAAEDVLRRALEREKEHEQQKKERLRALPPSPLERDW